LTNGPYQPVVVARQINAPASRIFQVLADPARHMEIDGSGMLRGAASSMPISGTGDVFVMKMYYSQLGHYEMNNHVVDYELDRRLSWEPEAGQGHPDADPANSAQRRWGHRWTFELTPVRSDATIVTEKYDCSLAPEDQRVGMGNGRVWVESMNKTLELLDSLCTGGRADPGPGG
jgi:uncharacterized protein YndB with AHSA1/START domain